MKISTKSGRSDSDEAASIQVSFSPRPKHMLTRNIHPSICIPSRSRQTTAVITPWRIVSDDSAARVLESSLSGTARTFIERRFDPSTGRKLSMSGVRSFSSPPAPKKRKRQRQPHTPWRSYVNSTCLINDQNIFRTNCDRRSRQNQSAAEAHLHTKNTTCDCCSASQPASDAPAIIRAKPFTESVACGFGGVMDQKGGRSIGTRENFHHLNL